MRVLLWIKPEAELEEGLDMVPVVTELEARGCCVERISSRAELAAALREGPVALVLARVSTSSREPLEWMAATPPDARPPVVLLATALDVPTYLEGMRCGAFDCVALPVQPSEFNRVARKALEACADPEVSGLRRTA
jgi:DNA-binding NtrC family response regulator